MFKHLDQNQNIKLDMGIGTLIIHPMKAGSEKRKVIFKSELDLNVDFSVDVKIPETKAEMIELFKEAEQSTVSSKRKLSIKSQVKSQLSRSQRQSQASQKPSGHSRNQTSVSSYTAV